MGVTLSPEAMADLLEFVRNFAVNHCRCDEADSHDEAITILKRHGLYKEQHGSNAN